MKILHLLGDCTLPDHPDEESTSGVVRAALEIARAQARSGHEVWMAVAGRSSRRSMWHGVHLVGLPSAAWAHVRANGRDFDFRRHLPYLQFTTPQGFDVVHGHLYSYLRFLHARVRVVHFHSDPFYSGHGNQHFDLKPEDLAHIRQHTDAQIAVSQFIAQDLNDRMQGRGNVHLVRYGVDAALFDSRRWQDAALALRQEWGISQDATVFLFAGAIVPEKGVIYLAQAFSQLAAENSNVHLALAGSRKLWGGDLAGHGMDDSYERDVRDTLHACVQAGRVHFLGKLPSSRMPIVYTASDVLVVPSIWREAFGLVALEMLATGRPVIASSVGGLAEFIDHRNGLLVPPGQEVPLKNAMSTLAADQDTRICLL